MDNFCTFHLPKIGVKKLFFLSGVFKTYYVFTKYWISCLRPVVESIFDDVIIRLDFSKNLLYILNEYMMVYIITKFRDSSFFQSEIEVLVGTLRVCPPFPKKKNKSKSIKRMKVNIRKQSLWELEEIG